MTDPTRGFSETLPEESAEELYENAPCGYFSTLPGGVFVRVNETFLRWTGYTREELIGHKRFQDLLTLAGKIYHETHLAPLLRMQGSVHEVALDLVGQTGQTLPVLINVVQKTSPLGEPELNRTTVFNASDRRQYERELLLARRNAEQEAEAKARLLALISHEIRSPLNTIAMLGELLQQSELDARQQRHVRTLRSASKHLGALVNDLLDYSKLESGKMTIDPRPFNFAELVESVIQRMEPRVEGGGPSLVVEIAPRLPEQLLGDPLKLNQVLTNLVGNALKFTEQGEVRVEVALAAELPGAVELDVAVRDTGIGIPPDRLDTIFDEFAQASADTTARFGGTGLGLTICRKLLQLFGSELTVHSTLGQGSVFAFRLRLDLPPHPSLPG